MKITHVIESSGGSADFVLYIVKHLLHHHHTIIYSDRTFGGKTEEVKKTFNTVLFLHWKYAQREINILSDIKATVALYKLLKATESDVIHVHSSKAGFLGRLVCFFLRKNKVIYTPNGLAYLRKDVSAFKRNIYIWLEKIAYWLNGKIISCSKSEADAMIEKGMHSDFINNGTEIFEYHSIKPKGDLSLVIATTGRVTIQKNPSLFNDIARRFENNPDFKFLWIGSGELEHQLTSSNIKITGWMNRSEVNNRLSEADIYISTALWEGLPFAVLESMNMNKPLLLSNCVGNVDLVVENFNGFIYNTLEEAVSKIDFFYNNPDTIKLFGNNSHLIAKEKFNVEIMASAYEKAYKSLLDYYGR